MSEKTEVVVDDFDKSFAEVAAQAERTPEQVAADAKAAEDAAAAAALAAETPEAKLAREAAEKTAADAAAKAAAEAALAAETTEAKTAREAAEKAAADAAAKVAADAEVARKTKEAEVAAAEAARVAAAAVETPEAKAAREAFELSIKPYEPTDAEKVALAQFEKDFPNEFAAVQARLKGVDRDINARVYAAVQNIVKHTEPRLAAVEATTVNEAAERHFTALKAAHPDYDAVIIKVPEWIKAQPAYVQPAMQAAYDGGTTQDVLALVADYKKAAGITATDPVAAAKALAEANAVTAAATAKAKAKADAESLEPVGTRRTTAGPKGKADPNDYEGAWAELAAASK